MSYRWHKEFTEKIREARRQCIDILRAHDKGQHDAADSLSKTLARSFKQLMAQWDDQFPGRGFPKLNDIERHLRIAERVDIYDLLTKDLFDAEEKALAVVRGSTVSNESAPYVDPKRVDELKSAATNGKFDLSRLILMCDELNGAYRSNHFISVAMLVRGILDHIPPIFGYSSFPEVVNNYAGSKSFKESAKHLQESCRKIGDAYLHTQIRKTESQPTNTQIDFRQSLDVVLAEVVRLLRA